MQNVYKICMYLIFSVKMFGNITVRYIQNKTKDSFIHKFVD